MISKNEIDESHRVNQNNGNETITTKEEIWQKPTANSVSTASKKYKRSLFSHNIEPFKNLGTLALYKNLILKNDIISQLFCAPLALEEFLLLGLA